MASRIINGFEACMREIADKRCKMNGLDKHLFPCGGPRPKSLIEISGASGSGKSMLLCQLMARCLLPARFGGRSCDIVFIDLAHKLDVAHLEQLLRRLMRESTEDQRSDTDVELVVKKCLGSVCVLSCYKPDDYTVALEAAETTLLQNANCALLAIDGMDSYYWLDSHTHPLRMQTHYERNVDRLRRLCEQHNVCCAYTVNTYYLDVKKHNAGQVRGGRGRWPSSVQVDYRLRLQRTQDREISVNGSAINIDDDGIHYGAD